MTHQPELIVALIVALCAALTDLSARRVPNRLVLMGAVAGLCLATWSTGMAGFLQSLFGAIAGMLIFLPFYLLRGLGAGDVKLMGALGACMGFIAVIQTALIASLFGAFLALATAVRHKALGRTLANTGRLLASWVMRGPRPPAELTLDNPRTLKIPYAVPIALGAAFVILSR